MPPLKRKGVPLMDVVQSKPVDGLKGGLRCSKVAFWWVERSSQWY